MEPPGSLIHLWSGTTDRLLIEDWSRTPWQDVLAKVRGRGRAPTGGRAEAARPDLRHGRKPAADAEDLTEDKVCRFESIAAGLRWNRDKEINKLKKLKTVKGAIDEAQADSSGADADARFIRYTLYYNFIYLLIMIVFPWVSISGFAFVKGKIRPSSSRNRSEAMTPPASCSVFAEVKLKSLASPQS